MGYLGGPTDESSPRASFGVQFRAFEIELGVLA